MPEKKNFSLILCDIRSTHNVGSMFRTADAAGVTKIYLVGYTPTPIDQYGRVRNDVIKVSLGAEKSVLWEHHPDPKVLVEQLKAEGVEIVALEQSPRSVDYKNFVSDSDKPSALIVGNEVEGVPERILELCDAVIDIPMRGMKESLNVTVATGIALFRLLDR
jgi:23S rRNA (guanosine2251-2'-O)-methyltransferase